jgi:hypothetical protein
MEPPMLAQVHMRKYADIGLKVPQVYLPKKGTELAHWAVIACDQFTSQPDYWQRVEELVCKKPSTFNLTLPEIYLERPDEAERIKNIQQAMRKYLDDSILEPREGMIYVERSVDGKTRKGIILALDLECYDYTKGSSSLIRATEGTIMERLVTRMKIREDAVLELPHTLVLIDDPDRSVIEPIEAAKGRLEELYDFDLMLNSGHLSGYAVSMDLEAQVVKSLQALARPDVFAAKYGVTDRPVLLFAMGDGNHSLATAKESWEKMKLKPGVGMDHPARYALVEIENIHDEALEFEPIHRVLFGLKKDIFAAMQAHFGENFTYTRVANAEEMLQRVNSAQGCNHIVGVVGGGKTFGVVEIANPRCNLPVGTLQAFLDRFLEEGGAKKIDYVHGEDVVCELGAQTGNVGFYLAGMQKSDLFKTVILDGALPRKTFSMGQAHEKRFYMEARKIRHYS